MAVIDYRPFLELVSSMKKTPEQEVWLAFDEGADVLYVNFTKPSVATDSEMTEDDVIVRYDGDRVIGLTVLHVSERTEK